MDTIEGGKWLTDQDLAWTLVTKAVERIHELENELGCFFDRNPDGTVHQKAFAGQTFDRTVHKGDLTGIEIINRLAEQVWARGIEPARGAPRGRADHDGRRRGARRRADDRHARRRASSSCRRRAVLLATGGGPTMYRYHTPSGDKTLRRHGDGAARRAAAARHGDGAVPSDRAARRPGHAHDRHGARGRPARRRRPPPQRRRRALHGRATTRAASARRATSSRARSIAEMRAGRTHAATAASTSQMSHLGADNVRRQFKGMVERCADCGFDLAGGLVEVVPTAHYMMGGVVFDADCRTRAARPFRRRRGHGRRARREPARRQRRRQLDRLRRHRRRHAWPRGCAREGALARAGRGGDRRRRSRAHEAPFAQPPRQPRADPRSALRLHVERRRHPARRRRLARAPRDASPSSMRELARIGVADGDRAFNLSWHDWLNLESLIAVSRVIAAAGAGARGLARRALSRRPPHDRAISRRRATSSCSSRGRRSTSGASASVSRGSRRGRPSSRSDRPADPHGLVRIISTPAAPPARPACRPRAAACRRGCAACAGSAPRCRSCGARCG